MFNSSACSERLAPRLSTLMTSATAGIMRSSWRKGCFPNQGRPTRFVWRANAMAHPKTAAVCPATTAFSKPSATHCTLNTKNRGTGSATSSIPKLFPSTPSTAVSHPQPGAESGNTLKKTPPDTATQACRKDTDVQHELFAEKQILGGQCRGRSECETEEDQSINEHMRSAVQEPKQSGETRHSRQNRTIGKALDSRPTIMFLRMTVVGAERVYMVWAERVYIKVATV